MNRPALKTAILFVSLCAASIAASLLTFSQAPSHQREEYLDEAWTLSHLDHCMEDEDDSPSASCHKMDKSDPFAS